MEQVTETSIDNGIKPNEVSAEVDNDKQNVVTPKETVSDKDASKPSVNPFVSETVSENKEETAQTEEEYQIKCPEYVSQEEVKAHIDAFKQAGVDAKTAQKIVDRLVEHGKENEKALAGQLEKELGEDKKALKSEYPDYSQREKDIARYIKETGIEDADVGSLVSNWGFKKVFKFFDRYAQMGKESSVGDTFAREEGSTGMKENYDKMFNSPEFIETYKNKPEEAQKIIQAWAMKEAQMQQ